MDCSQPNRKGWGKAKSGRIYRESKIILFSSRCGKLFSCERTNLSYHTVSMRRHFVVSLDSLLSLQNTFAELV
jgi:hypothetical protein